MYQGYTLYCSPVAGEFPDESYDVGDLEASDIVRKVVEEGQRQHHFAVSVIAAEGDVVRLLEGVEDELTASVIGGMDAVLVSEAGGPQGLLFSFLPIFFFRVDGQVILVKRGLVIVKLLGYPRLPEVDVFSNY